MFLTLHNMHRHQPAGTLLGRSNGVNQTVRLRITALNGVAN